MAVGVGAVAMGMFVVDGGTPAATRSGDRSVAHRRVDGVDWGINDQAKRLLLTGTVAPGQNFINTKVLLELLAAGSLPVNSGAKLCRKISLLEDMVCDVGQELNT